MFVQWLFVFHVLGFIMWIGSLMIVTRVMAFHAGQEPAVASKLGTLEKKLFMGGALPGMLLTIVAGLWIAFELDWNPIRPSISGPSFHIKLSLVAVLLVLHFMIQAGIQKLERGDAGAGRFKAYHGIVSLIALAIIIAAAVLYPYFVAKKATDMQESPPVTSSVSR